MMTDKKHQHYVWRAYLEPWTRSGSLFCLRAGKVFGANPRNVGGSRYFYQSKELNSADIEFIEQLVISVSPAPLRSIHRNWLKGFNTPFQILKLAKDDGDGRIEEMRTRLENNIQEEVHSRIEGGGGRFVASLLSGDMTFYRDNENKIEFLQYLCVQFSRTNKIKTAVLAGSAKTIKEKLGIDFGKVWNPLAHILATNLAANLAAGDFKIQLLENRSSLSLVTGDQPVVNACAAGVPKGAQVERVELYYPISPRLGILITDDPAKAAHAIVTIGDDAVARYNDHIIENAFEEIYGDSREAVERYLISKV